MIARDKHTEGFSMAELLTVVAILAILMAIAGIGIYNYLRDLTLTEYDNAAKSIYIAAQNNIADLQASGEWAANEDTYTKGDAKQPTAERTDDEGKTRAEDDHYYYIDAKFAQDHGILPQGTVEAQVWSGDYIIEYRYDTGTVYGVFYTEKRNEALADFYKNGGTIRNRDTRRNHEPIIGYYGGANAANLESATLEAPIVSAGRSADIAVTDPNLTSSPELKTTTLVTIEKVVSTDGKDPTSAQDPTATLKLALSSNNGIPKVSVVGLVGELVDRDFVKLNQEGDTYSLDLLKIMSHAQLTQFVSGFTAGDEYKVTARCSTSVKIARPTYGYGTGIWPGSDAEDVIFTSNIIADFETEADLVVYRDEVNKQADGSTSEGQDYRPKEHNITFNLENWYNDQEEAKEELYYRIEHDGRIQIKSVTKPDAANHPVEVKEPDEDFYYYPMVGDNHKHIAHTVTLVIPTIASIPDGTTMDLHVKVYKQGTFEGVPSDVVSKTLTIHFIIMNQRPFQYYVEDHGAYGEVVIAAGSSRVRDVFVFDSTSGNVVADKSNPLFDVIDKDGGQVKLKNTLPAGSAVSIKFFKTDTSIPLGSSNFEVQATIDTA